MSHDKEWCKWTDLALVIYVDDLTYGGNDQRMISEFKQALDRKFKVVHEGPIKWILGIEVIRDKRAGVMSLNQKLLIHSTVSEFVGLSEGRIQYSSRQNSFK